MSYEPTTWKAGDTVTSAKLNKLEQGVASSGGVVMPTYTTSDGEIFTCDTEFLTIIDAIEAGKCTSCKVIMPLSENSDDTMITIMPVYGASRAEGSIVYETLEMHMTGPSSYNFSSMQLLHPASGSITTNSAEYTAQSK